MSYISVNNVSVNYGESKALVDVNLNIEKNSICAFIGPSGCGKTTLLRSINRMNDFVEGFSLEGNILIDGVSIYERNDTQFVNDLRRNMGMIFQKPTPLPMTVINNLLMPLKEYSREKEGVLREIALEKLKLAAMYDEVKDRLNRSAMSLSGGQQQRLCIARALLLSPEILLLDEPCSALDPISTFKIEELLTDLKREYTIIMVTHNMEQAKRIADKTAFFYEGRLAEEGKTYDLFNKPKTDMFFKFVTGRRVEDNS